MSFPKQQKNIYSVPFLAKEHGDFVLWFFTGSKCNLECTHCYVESSPTANQHPFLEMDTFHRQLREAISAGYKKIDIYFTGGEPFINPNLLEMFEVAIMHGDVTVLTNATTITKNIARKLKLINESSEYHLEFRVSFDGPNKVSNDIIRGKKAFERADRGTKNLIAVGFNPIITAMRSWSLLESDQIESQFKELLVGYGIPEEKQKLKIIPQLRIGREADRDRPYVKSELFTLECFTDYDYNDLQCSKCRMVTERGTWVCPILVNDDQAKMSDNLTDSFKPYKMKQLACWTCRMEGMVCTN